MQDHFQEKAKKWDQGSVRVNGAKIIADAIKTKVSLDKNMKLMDFGVGTGLLGFELAKDVGHILGVDTSEAMLEKLQEKNTPELSIEALNIDITQTPLDQTFDGIISSMTLHHVENLSGFFSYHLCEFRREWFYCNCRFRIRRWNFSFRQYRSISFWF